MGISMIYILRKVWRVVLTAIVIAVPLWFLFGLWSMSASHTYHSQAQVYLESAQKVLIAHDICRDKSDCVKRQILFGDGGAARLGPYESGGVQLYIYEISSAEVVGDLVKALGETYKTLKGPAVTMLVFESKHHEAKTQFASVKIK